MDKGKLRHPFKNAKNISSFKNTKLFLNFCFLAF